MKVAAVRVGGGEFFEMASIRINLRVPRGFLPMIFVFVIESVAGGSRDSDRSPKAL